jgi:transposase
VESVRRWVRQADTDDGVVDGQTSSEQNELVQLRRDKRRLEMETEILRRAAAYFAVGSLPKLATRWSALVTHPWVCRSA